jgi:hypothetical protein
VTKAKISEYDPSASNNTDVNGVNISEGCPPSGINDAIREVMAALKRFETGSDGDSVTVGGNLVVSGSTTISGSTVISGSATISGSTVISGSATIANSATLSNVISASINAGSAATPTIHAVGDADTGIFFPAANTIAFTEGGTEALRIDSDGDIGIGIDSPAAPLHVRRSTATTDAVTQILRIDSQSSGTPSNGIGVGIEFATETAAGNTEVGATIEAITTDVTSTSEDFDLSFKTMAAGAAAAERMRVKSTGDFQFNSGYGSVATAYGCRAWVNFNGTGTVAIRESGNVSSITDNGTGNYTVDFATAMPDANYSAHVSFNPYTIASRPVPAGYTTSTSGVSVQTRVSNTAWTTSVIDYPDISVAIFR